MSDENIVSEPRPEDPERNFRPDRMIHEITLRNILSFGPDTPPLKLGNLNVLIGPNGSGKSNLIEAIGLLQAAPRDVWQPIRKGGGMSEWVFKGAIDALSDVTALIHYDRSRPLLKYDQYFRTDREEPYLQEVVSDVTAATERETYFKVAGGQEAEILSYGTMRTVQWDLEHEGSVLRSRRDPDATPELAHLAEQFDAIRIYRDWVFGNGNPLRAPQRTDLPGARLNEDYSNFGMFLSKRYSKRPTQRKWLVDTLKSIYAEFTDIQFELDSNTVTLMVHEGHRSIPAIRLSDGTLRFLLLCAILLDPEPPPLICMEEPELGLHPDVVGKLAGLLKVAADRTQLIITTHSSTLVDHLTDMPEAVVVFGKQNGATTMERLRPEKLQAWLRDYNDSLGALWTSGEIGGNRW